LAYRKVDPWKGKDLYFLTVLENGDGCVDIAKNMKVVMRVAETGSFTAAAKLSDIATGQVSRIISEMELYLRTRLLIRTTRKVVLTEAGQRYLRAADQ
jgi:DNA-binding transcriptional LysR family regulator